jgi:sec-independent protein translocase protein TatA
MEFVGAPELLIVLVVVLIIFGPTRLPGLARSLGETIHEFRRTDSSDGQDVAKDKNDRAVEADRSDAPAPGDSFL